MAKNQLQKAIQRWKRQRIKIIAVAGARKSGKDVLAAYLKRHYTGFRHIRIAEGPLRVARVLDLPPDRKTYHALFGMNALLYPFLGEAVFKRRAARIIDREKPRFVIVEALRTKEEYQEFVGKRKGVLVAVVADPEIRYERVLRDAHRAQKHDEARLSFKEFMGSREKKTGEFVPGEREVGWVVGRAHFVLTNNYKTPTPFYRDIDQVMEVLGLKKRRR